MLIRHIFRLVFHIILLAIALVLYFIDSERLNYVYVFRQGLGGMFLWVVWLALAIPMLFRIIPNRRIAMGARKHFACSFDPVDTAAKSRVGELRRLHKGAFLCGLSWFTITAAVIFALHWLDMLTPAAILIIALAYAFVDLVFVLFFCPFRTLFMGNHCCATCRIHNWDYFMKCAPLILSPNAYSISLVALSAAVVLCWEISLCRNPQFFMDQTNRNLHCGTCEDKLCGLRLKKSAQRAPDTDYR